MILSLLIVGVCFVVAVAFIGISPIGEMVIGGEGTTSYAMNATVWNAYSTLGSSLWFGFALIIGIGICLLLYISFKWMEPKDNT